MTAAGVARGTFYLYFESKAQVFLAIADDFYDRLELAIDPRLDRGIAELRQSAYTYFADRFRRVQALGLVRPSLSPDIVAHLQVGMFEELVKAFVLGVDHPDIDALADQMADFEWNGVRPAPG